MGLTALMQGQQSGLCEALFTALTEVHLHHLYQDTWGLSRSTWGQGSSYCLHNDLHVPWTLFSCCGLYQQAAWLSRQRRRVPGRTGALDRPQDSTVRERRGDQQ